MPPAAVGTDRRWRRLAVDAPHRWRRRQIHAGPAATRTDRRWRRPAIDDPHRGGPAGPSRANADRERFELPLTVWAMVAEDRASGVRLAELVAALSLAIDLGLG